MNKPNPYAAPSSIVDDTSSYDDPYWGGAAPLATRGSRLAAAILDALVYMGVGGVAGAVVVMLGMDLVEADDMSWQFAVAVLFFMLPVIGYNLYLLHQNGQTLGKKWMKIKIVRADRRTKASLGRIVGLRIVPVWLVSMIPVVGNLGSLIDVLFIFGDEQQCLHDMIADTNVVVADYDSSIEADDVSW